MAKKKEIEPIAVEAETAVHIPEEPEVEAKASQELTKEEMTEQFITNQLKAINRMSNKARARRLAKRVLDNRKGI